MAISFKEDTVRDISCIEERGKVVQLTRSFIAYDSTGASYEAVLNMLDSTSLPTYNTYPDTHENLRLVKRSVSIMPQDPTKAEVLLEYAAYGEDGMNFVFSVDTSLSQIETEVDKYGSQIFTAHTYSSADPDYPSEMRYQGGQVSVLAPQTTARGEGILKTDRPAVVSNRWAGSVNLYSWVGGAPGTWLCTRCSATPHNLSESPKWWNFIFEFQYDQTGHNPDVFYIDERTGRPPVNIVSGTGAKTVNWYRQIDFGQIF